MAHAPASSKALYLVLPPIGYLSTNARLTDVAIIKISAMSHYALLPCTMCILDFGSWLEPRYIFAAGQLI